MVCSDHLLPVIRLRPIGGCNKTQSLDVRPQNVRVQGVAVVTGTDNPAHMADDLDVWRFSLSSDDVAAIDAIQQKQLEP